MQFTIDSTLTVDVALSQPIDLLKAVRNGDKETLKEAVTVVDFNYDISRGE